jgi:hypothetical protein
MSDALDWTGVAAAIHTWVVGSSGLAADKVFWAYEGRPRPAAPYIELTVRQIRGIGHDWVTSDANPLTFSTLTVAAVAADTFLIPAHGLSTGDGPVHVASTVTLPSPLVANTDYWVRVVDVDTIKLADTFVKTGGVQPAGAANPVTTISLATPGSGVITVAATADTVHAGQEIVRTAQGFREATIHLECFAVEGGGYDAMRRLSNVIASLPLYAYDLDQAGVGVSDLGQSFAQGGVQYLEGHRGSILEPRSMCDFTCYLASLVTGYDTVIASVSGNIELASEGGDALDPIPFEAP